MALGVAEIRNDPWSGKCMMAGSRIAPFVSISPSKVTWQMLLPASSTSGSGGSSADQCDSSRISCLLISSAQRGRTEEADPGRRYSIQDPCRVASVARHGCADGLIVTCGKCSLPRLFTDNPVNPG